MTLLIAAHADAADAAAVSGICVFEQHRVTHAHAHVSVDHSRTTKGTVVVPVACPKPAVPVGCRTVLSCTVMT